MGATEEKIALIVEAVNRFKGTFDELSNSLKGVDEGHKKIQTSSSGMLQAMKENWVAVTAAIAAFGIAVNQALEYMEIAAKDQQAEDSFRKIAAAAGESADEILAAMDRAANGTIDDGDIMQKAAKGMMQGLSGAQLVQIMEAARIAARTTGEDVKTAYENITDALANKMPRGLIKYGLVTREQMKLLESNMASGVREVDLFKLAMANFADQAAKQGPIAENNSEKLQKLAVWWQEVKKTIGEGIWTLISGIKSLAVGTVEVVMGVMTGAIAGIMGLFLLLETGLNKIGLRSDAELAKTKEDFEKLKNASKNYFSSAFGGGEKPETTGTSPKKPGGGGNSGKDAIEAQMRKAQELIALEATFSSRIADVESAEKTRDISHLQAAEKRIDLTKALISTQEEHLGLIDKEKNPQQWAAQQKAVDETRRKLIDLGLASRQLSDDFEGGFREGLSQYIDQVGNAFKQAVKLAQDTAQAMERAFSDFFFDIMTGKVKSFSDYLRSFLESVARAMANMMAQNTAQGIAGAISGWLNSSGGQGAAGGGGEMGMDSWPSKHSGGLVMHRGGYVPRFHVGGLSSDEVPAILQKGEYVVSRKGVAALDKINAGQGGAVNFVMNVDNQTGTPIESKNTGVQFDGEKFVVSVVLKNIEGYGAIRSAITGLK